MPEHRADPEDGMSTDTYKVVRFQRDEGHPDHRMVVKSGISHAEARAHCQDPASKGHDGEGNVAWFDGYEKESK